MIQRENLVPTHGGPVEAALAEYFTRVDRGESVDLIQLIAAYPGCEAGLRRFLNKERKLKLAVVETPPAATPSEHLTGRALGDYRILRELGRGGMGVVYEAEQLSLGRRVALKVLPFGAMLGKQQLVRFKNEARAAATLDHPNIVAIYSVGSDGDVHYYAMQLIEGQSLAEVIVSLRRNNNLLPPPLDKSLGDGVRSTDAEQLTTDYTQSANTGIPSLPQSELLDPQPALPVPSLRSDARPSSHISTLPEFQSRDYYRFIARLGVQAAEALDHAHQNGILHRDIKPGNLLLDSGGKLYVTDFGLARIEADAGMTMTGDIIGTLRYMAPEQALAKRVVLDHRADIYSLGATLYEFLTLQPVFAETDHSELLKKIAFEEPRPLRHFDRHIPVELETIALKAMRKSPEQRYATAQELADDLQSFLENKPIKAKPPTRREQVLKWSQRHPAAIWAAILFLVATTIVSAVSTVLIAHAYNREAEQRKLAEVERERAQKHFVTARIAIRDLFFVPGNGSGEWSELSPSLRKKLADQAAKFYQGLLQLESTVPALQYETAVGYRSLAMIHNLNNEYQQSENLLNQSIATLDSLLKEYPDTFMYQSQLVISKRLIGTTLFLQKKFAEADAALVSAISLCKTIISRSSDPSYLQDFYECWTMLEHQRHRRGNSSKAWMDEIVAAYQDYVPRVPENSVARLHMGDALYHQGRLDEAIATYKEVIRLQPTTGLVHRCLGDVLLEKGRREEALAAYREEVRLQPDDHETHAQNGVRMANMGLWDEATASYREALRLKPDEAKYHECLGDVLHQAGLRGEAPNEYQAAITTYRTAIQLNPNDAVALGSLARMLVTCGEHDLREPQESAQLAKKAVELAPHTGEARNTLGLALYRAANYRGAVETLQESLELHGEEPSSFFFLAMAEWQLGNRDAARAWYAKGINWLKERPQIVGGNAHRFRAEAEELLVPDKTANPPAEADSE